MRVSLLFAVVVLAGCVGGSPGGGGPTLCELPKCPEAGDTAVRPGDPAQHNTSVDDLSGNVLALRVCVAGRENLEQARDWSEGVVLDLLTGEVVWHHVRNTDETVTSTECADAEAATVMTRITPPEDWRFGRHLFGPCEPGDVQQCGCPGARTGQSLCVESYTYGEPYKPDAWTDCDCG